MLNPFPHVAVKMTFNQKKHFSVSHNNICKIILMLLVYINKHQTVLLVEPGIC